MRPPWDSEGGLNGANECRVIHHLSTIKVLVDWIANISWGLRVLPSSHQVLHHFVLPFHSSISFLHFIPPFHAFISFLHFIPPFHSSIPFLHFIPPFHSSISFLHFIPPFHSFIPFLHFIPPFLFTCNFISTIGLNFHLERNNTSQTFLLLRQLSVKTFQFPSHF